MRPPDDHEHGHQQQHLIERIVGEDGHARNARTGHYVLVEQGTGRTNQRARHHRPHPAVGPEVDALAPPHCAEEVEKDERDHQPRPLQPVGALGKDDESPRQSPDGSGGADGRHYAERQMLEPVVDEYPRPQHYGRLGHQQQMHGARYGRHIDPAVGIYQPRVRGPQHRSQHQRRGERADQQHRQHRIAVERIFAQDVVEAQEEGRQECKSEPHD